MSEKKSIYPAGIRTFKPHPKAPDFIKGTLIISLNELAKFCKENPELLTEYKGEKQLKCKMLDGKFGISIEVDTWRAEKKEPEDLNPDKTDIPF